MKLLIDFDALFENDLDACALTDASETVLRVNRAFTGMFGYSAEEAIGRALDDLIVPPRLRGEARAYAQHTLERRELKRETIRQRKDGSQVPVSVLAQMLEGDGGSGIVYVQYRDITEQKHATESLRAMIQNAPLGILVVDITGRIEQANETFARMSGFSVEELRGMEVTDFSHPDEQAHNLWYREELVAGRRDSYRIEKRYRRKDGSWFWGGLTVALVRAADGSPLQMIGVVEDITERHGTVLRREAALSLFASLIETMRTGVLVENAGRRIIAANPAFLKLFRIPGQPGDLLDMDCREAAATSAKLMENPDGFINGIEQRIALEKPARDQFRTRDGRTFERDYATIRDAGGQITGHLWVYNDLTDLLQLQDQLRQSMKMEAVGRLAGGVAHDFNNLLTVLQGHAALLLEEDLPTHVTDDLHEILKAANKAAALTRQLLAFSRQQVLKPVTLDLNEVVRELEKNMLRMIREDIALRTALDPDTPRVRADRTQIEQVLLNLAVNARDAMPHGGRLDVKTSRLLLHDATNAPGFRIPPNCYAVLEVSDSGDGIDPAILPRIFDPFFTTKEQGKGTGLGLATVYGIVKQSGGYISVDSEPGHGTTFRIFLPQSGAP